MRDGDVIIASDVIVQDILQGKLTEACNVWQKKSCTKKSGMYGLINTYRAEPASDDSLVGGFSCATHSLIVFASIIYFRLPKSNAGGRVLLSKFNQSVQPFPSPTWPGMQCTRAYDWFRPNR